MELSNETPAPAGRYKIKTEESSHWYTRDGASAHTVPKKTSKTGERRNTTLTDARKMGLLPSVSEYLGIIANEGLVRWKLGQVALAGARITRHQGEDDESFADRIIAESLHGVRGAADFGTVMHAIIEDYLVHHIHPDFEPGDRTADFWPPVRAWLDDNIAEVLRSEYTVISRTGYAGRVDLKVMLKGQAFIEACMANPEFDGRCILDFKTRKPDPSGKLVSHDRELWQLSAYSAADPDTRLSGTPLPVANLYINSEEPGDLRLNVYNPDEIDRGIRIFGHIVGAWTLIKNYDASFESI